MKTPPQVSPPSTETPAPPPPAGPPASVEIVTEPAARPDPVKALQTRNAELESENQDLKTYAKKMETTLGKLAKTPIVRQLTQTIDDII